jgi:CO/xanthine dehydrogenase FAD-binding subunit
MQDSSSRPLNYHRPRSIDAALAELDKPGAVVLAGGTDFYPQRLTSPSRELEYVVDIGAIDDIVGIRHANASWRFGGATTWTEIVHAELPPAFAGLQQAAGTIGGRQIQNVGTIAGNLCTASPAADSVPALLTLEASVELTSRNGIRTLPLDEFIIGYRSTALRSGELLTGVIVPDPSPDARSAFLKLGQRAFLVISIVMVACVATVVDRRIASIRVAVGSCSPVARRLIELEGALVGCRTERDAISTVLATADLSDLAPIDDVRGSANYRRSAVTALVADCVAAATELR